MIFNEIYNHIEAIDGEPPTKPLDSFQLTFDFMMKFGHISRDDCFAGRFTYDPLEKKKGCRKKYGAYVFPYDTSEKFIDELCEKSVRENHDYVYDYVKDKIETFEPDVLY